MSDNCGARTLKFHAFSVTGGTVAKAKRLQQGKNLRWNIQITPTGDETLTIVLPKATDCDAQGSICTADGRKLSNRNQATITGPGG